MATHSRLKARIVRALFTKAENEDGIDALRLLAELDSAPDVTELNTLRDKVKFLESRLSLVEAQLRMQPGSTRTRHLTEQLG